MKLFELIIGTFQLLMLTPMGWIGMSVLAGLCIWVVKLSQCGG